MKEGVSYYSIPQPPTAIEVLEKRSAEISAPFKVIDGYSSISSIKLGLAADFQETNASLAIAIAWKYLFLTKYNLRNSLPPAFIRGLEEVRWPGRCEIRREENIS